MRKIILTAISVIVVIISLLGFTYSYELNDDRVVSFSLIGPTTVLLEVNNPYEEYGVTCIYGNTDVSSSVIIDSSKVNTSKLGEYKVKYSLRLQDREEYIYRVVKVSDTTKPVIELNGVSEQVILVDSTYIEDGYKAMDNYDGDITDSVKIDGKVNTKKEGTYILKYSVNDSSGNGVSITRKVIVTKPTITIEDYEANIVTASSYNVNKYSNTIIKNQFNDNGIYYEGYVKEDSNTYAIKLKNISSKQEYTFNMEKTKTHYYRGDMDLTTLSYGTYEAYIVASKEERLLNGLSNLNRIVRSRIGDKLITFTYDDNKVKILVEKFKYQYDFVIDPGHGGSDTGASNGVILEKNMNLIQSLYEKCRYESMGYRVYMTRYDDTYGEMLGSKNMLELQRRSLTVGYYGSVSKVSYSNHHNAVSNTSSHGFEILVANDIDKEHMLVNKELYSKYLKYYDIEPSRRIYSRDLATGSILDKTNDQVYSYQNYYAMIRIPRELFNVFVTIYEPIYISNTRDFNWYWIKKKVIDVTEIKIETYVNYLGGKYDKDNSSCVNIFK